MTATIMDGRATLAVIKDELRVRIKALADAGRTPGLGTVLVGDDPGSHAYVAGKHRDCADVGIVSLRRDLPTSASQDDVEAVVAELRGRGLSVSEPREVAATGSMQSFLSDPDGNRIELQQPA